VLWGLYIYTFVVYIKFRRSSIKYANDLMINQVVCVRNQCVIITKHIIIRTELISHEGSMYVVPVSIVK